MDHLSTKWTLKSLTIGPQPYETNTQFWEKALSGLSPLPNVGEVTIIHNYPTTEDVNTDCWVYFDRILTRRDLFPALRSVRVQPTIGWSRFGDQRWLEVWYSFRGLQSSGSIVRKFPCVRARLWD